MPRLDRIQHLVLHVSTSVHTTVTSLTDNIAEALTRPQVPVVAGPSTDAATTAAAVYAASASSSVCAKDSTVDAVSLARPAFDVKESPQPTARKPHQAKTRAWPPSDKETVKKYYAFCDREGLR